MARTAVITGVLSSGVNAAASNFDARPRERLQGPSNCVKLIQDKFSTPYDGDRRKFLLDFRRMEPRNRGGLVYQCIQAELRGKIGEQPYFPAVLTGEPTAQIQGTAEPTGIDKDGNEVFQNELNPAETWEVARHRVGAFDDAEICAAEIGASLAFHYNDIRNRYGMKLGRDTKNNDFTEADFYDLYRSDADGDEDQLGAWWREARERYKANMDNQVLGRDRDGKDYNYDQFYKHHNENGAQDNKVNQMWDEAQERYIQKNMCQGSTMKMDFVDNEMCRVGVSDTQGNTGALGRPNSRRVSYSQGPYTGRFLMGRVQLNAFNRGADDQNPTREHLTVERVLHDHHVRLMRSCHAANTHPMVKEVFDFFDLGYQTNIHITLRNYMSLYQCSANVQEATNEYYGFADLETCFVTGIVMLSFIGLATAVVIIVFCFNCLERDVEEV